MNVSKKMKTVLVVGVGILVMVAMFKGMQRPSTASSAPTVRWPNDRVSQDVADETLQFVAAQFRDTQRQLEALAEQQAAQQQQLDAMVERGSTPTPLAPSLPEPTASVEAPQLLSTVASPLGVIPDLRRSVTTLSTTTSSAPVPTTLDATTPIAYYTIPANATAIQTTLMTALIGRVPQKGKVQDPYPFKLLLDQTVLAANGLVLDALAGMVLSGVTVGDLSPRGARGWITSLTFLFQDGTIQTVGQSASADLQPQQSLGYLTDVYGNPSIDGVLISDAPRQIAQMMALGATKGASDALSDAQITRHRQRQGDWQAVTGNRSHYLAGQAASQSLDQAMSWLGDRLTSTFDAVVVPAGTSVVIHFTQEIPIDYQPEGRRLRHAQRSLLDSTAGRVGLD